MTTNPDIGTMLGYVILIGFLVLYTWWVIVENMSDWVNRPKRSTRHISLLLTFAGAVAVVLHVVGFNRLHVDLLWWSMPFLALVCSFALGVVNPEAGIGVAFRFMTLAGPAALLGSAMGFIPLLAGQTGGCILGFRLGERLHRLCSGSREQ